MNVKEIVAGWLKANGYDGLCNTDIPCGCLLGDLAPCGEMHESCQAGFRRNISEHASCDCDGSGTDHWHVEVPLVAGLEAHLQDAENWKCECGKRCNPSAAEWRWNGQAWEHHHGYPVGYVAAIRIPNASGLRPAASDGTVPPVVGGIFKGERNDNG